MICIPGVCKLCRAGSLGFWTCDDLRTVVIMCDECDAVWAEPRRTDAASAMFPSGPSFNVPGTSVSIAQPKSHWSSLEEVTNVGWTEWISK